ncbi:flagellar hook-associated protein FlgL [Sporolactobacillus terrae]|uniref:Flagellar hook-associated protein 3 n=1 Tax=Sporolactobacillus terrae TaxID=269673 RepID=A0A410D758_9BACL|nr:flagellar hook-associated protein FlgL [Sporolactobacillus terrae]QAA21942.1 flagellar hook-associated protein FlgL [Sporolactobacillus terrae]QAA24915.1 flagellar hook-associated protein FlgL [Sporolactobacillus terrae]UAK16734.1 flagellar hook-associated protein FlgL [Sporolactobacillus terrae]BBN98218.1 flagellar hook-associated protein 3 [Sporolactobacillus terrae]
MRVTQGMMTNQVLRNISNGYSKVSEYNDQLSSGKKITRPSQDPVVATMGIAYRTDVSHVNQYQKNVTNAYKWLDSSDDTLQQVNDVLNRIRELTNEASTDTYTADQRKAIGTEVDQLTTQLVTLGNTQVGGQYIFSGSDSANPLLTLNDGNVQINDDAIDNPDFSVAVNDGIQMAINVNPNQVFTSDLFANLNQLKDDLNNGASGETISAHLTEIDTHLEQVGTAQADLGAKTNRIDLIQNRLNEQKTVATKIMSTNEDADYAETIINLNTQQNVYNASLSVGAKIIQTSLVDFLR